MPEIQRRSSSIYTLNLKPKDKDFLQRRVNLSGKQLTVGLIFGVFLTITTIVLHSIALFTPHWKEISPSTHSLYVDGVDALIRTEILVYFNTVHRFTHHSYGLFHRCEYHATNNTPKYIPEKLDLINNGLNKAYKTCSKNFLPSYEDEQFNQCHSVEYYRFCSKKSKKNFDINDHYLRPQFDILKNSNKNLDSISLCNCYYPKYVRICQFLGIMGLITLILTAVFFAIFPFVKKEHPRVKVKCFAVLAAILSTIFLIINLLVVLHHRHYESIEYFTAIQRHYSLTQIYKLSQDTKTAIDRFLLSIKIEIGYSTILAWTAFGLSIIDGLLIMFTCKIKPHQDDTEPTPVFSSIPSYTPEQNENIQKEENQTVTIPLISSETLTNLLPPRSPPPLPPPLPSTPLPPTVVTTEQNEPEKTQSLPLHSCLKRPTITRIHFEDEV